MLGRSAIPLSIAPKVPFSEPDLVPEHKQAILNAIRWAWAELKRINPQCLKSGKEEEITEQLQNLLNQRQKGKRLAHWLIDFESVTRGENQRTIDGRICKKPDLVFRPPAYKSVINTTRWGWFIECKIINGSASIRAYRDDGVHRFASGEYSAWMKSAAMLAYVRDGSTPVPTLDKPLKGWVGTRFHTPGPSVDQSYSDHDRSGAPSRCVDITLTHIWLATA